MHLVYQDNQYDPIGREHERNFFSNLILYNDDKQNSLISDYELFRKKNETEYLNTLTEEDQSLIMEWKENNNLQYINENDLQDAIDASYIQIDEDFIPEDDEYDLTSSEKKKSTQLYNRDIKILPILIKTKKKNKK